VPEDAYGHWDSGTYSGSSPVNAPATNIQLGALTDVLRKMGIFSDEDKLRTVSQLVGRELTVLRGLRRDEANDLLKLLRVAPDGRETALASQS
jgi:hypothetical protein